MEPKSFLKKAIATVIVAGTMISASACNLIKSFSSSSKSATTNTLPASTFDESKAYPEIKKAYQSVISSIYDDVPYDFFSSAERNVGKITADVTWINPATTKNIEIAVNPNIEFVVRLEIERAVDYYNKIFKQINPEFNFYITSDTPTLFTRNRGDVIYFSELTDDIRENYFFNDFFAPCGLTVMKGNRSPNIYMNLSKADKYVRTNEIGTKHISLYHAVLHEIMHCFKYDHTTDEDDIMYMNIESCKSRRDYSEFSDKEIRAFIKSYSGKTDFADMLTIYNKMMGIEEKIDLSKSYNDTLNNLLKDKTQEEIDALFTTGKDADIIETNQIISMTSFSGKYQIVINGEKVRQYVLKYDGRNIYRGRCATAPPPKDSGIKAPQLIFLEDFPGVVNNDGTVDKVASRFIVPNHKVVKYLDMESKTRGSRWQMVAKLTNKSGYGYYYDTTEEYLKQVAAGKFYSAYSASASAQSDDLNLGLDTQVSLTDTGFETPNYSYDYDKNTIVITSKNKKVESVDYAVVKKEEENDIVFC